MASSSRTGKNISMFTPKKPHFVRIIMNDVMKNQKLLIPEKFERKHRNGLSKSVLLKVPNGEAWKVALSKLNDQVFFQDGWGKFSNYYSIDNGHFLVFEYEGNSQFSVFIFDKSATEISYPYNNQEGNIESAGSDSAEEETDDGDSSFQFIGELSSDSEETLYSSLDFQHRKSVGTDSAKAANEAQFSSMDREGIKGKAKLGSSKGVRRKQARKKRHQGGEPLAADGNAKALERNGVPDDNPYFTIQMQGTHLPPRSTLSVPSWFGRKYLTEEEGNVTLAILNEGSWPAQYRLCKTSGGSRVRLKKGWGRFAKMNRLAVGDICSFHLLKGDKVVFQVSICRPDQNKRI